MFTTTGSSQELKPEEAGVWRVGLLEGTEDVSVDSMLLPATILSISFLEMPVAFVKSLR